VKLKDTSVRDSSIQLPVIFVEVWDIREGTVQIALLIPRKREGDTNSRTEHRHTERSKENKGTNGQNMWKLLLWKSTVAIKKLIVSCRAVTNMLYMVA